jgi:hypothetical protein
MLALLAVCGLCVAADTQPAKKTWVEQMVEKMPASMVLDDKDDDIATREKAVKIYNWWRSNTIGKKVDYVGTLGDAKVEPHSVEKRIVVVTIRHDTIENRGMTFLSQCRVTLPHSMLEEVRKMNGEMVVVSGILNDSANGKTLRENRSVFLPTAMITKSIKKHEEPVAAK